MPFRDTTTDQLNKEYMSIMKQYDAIESNYKNVLLGVLGNVTYILMTTKILHYRFLHEFVRRIK